MQVRSCAYGRLLDAGDAVPETVYDVGWARFPLEPERRA
jgi:hypothetical protein